MINLCQSCEVVTEWPGLEGAKEKGHIKFQKASCWGNRWVCLKRPYLHKSWKQTCSLLLVSELMGRWRPLAWKHSLLYTLVSSLIKKIVPVWLFLEIFWKWLLYHIWWNKMSGKERVHKIIVLNKKCRWKQMQWDFSRNEKGCLTLFI